jgi:hypothetical protein
MSRIRTIKPEFWSDDKVVAVSRDARLLFIGIWNFADDAGNVERSAVQLKARVFPADLDVSTADIERMVDALIAHVLVIEYSVSGKKFLHIPGFAKHQVINRPSKPKCPPYESSLNAHGALMPGREGKGEEGRTTTPPQPLLKAETATALTEATAARGMRLAASLGLTEDSESMYAALPAPWLAWAAGERPDIDVQRTWRMFVDHWKAKPGQKGVGLDWQGTWRNWVRKETAPRGAAASGKQAALEARNAQAAAGWTPPATADEERY